MHTMGLLTVGSYRFSTYIEEHPLYRLVTRRVQYREIEKAIKSYGCRLDLTLTNHAGLCRAVLNKLASETSSMTNPIINHFSRFKVTTSSLHCTKKPRTCHVKRPPPLKRNTCGIRNGLCKFYETCTTVS
jgi:hypothetical protein